MLIFGIETSCDETAVSLIQRGATNSVIAEKIKSQIPLHAEYGGIVPEIASRTHLEVIDTLTESVLKKSKQKMNDIELIGVTQGPGLIGSLLVGLSFAKAISFREKIPLVPVDHIHSHIESVFIDHPDIEYPLVALVVSGGHTSLFYQVSKFETQLIAKTRDDAVGEVMDKIAKFYGLPYPGGPILDGLYGSGDPHRFSFTIPRMSDGSNDFSFSGYKTAVLRYTRQHKLTRDNQLFRDLVSSFLYSVIGYLVSKTESAVKNHSVKSVIVAGGVSRNSLLRKKFKEAFQSKNIPLYLPSPKQCTDNALMVAWLAYETYMKFPDRNYFDFHINAYSRAAFRENKKHR
ncbi:MAG: tRNA (adenosine(37)-N6)-threonylcarbamoyltransferase complex transferase subunit TsaD [Candidatus Aminicenantes bacterium]|nr:tRNA (adenosine(37)-N6)-threonylcarbamoyltransferase complex transferase subunit TsaD [Candidatus Aminicenantes bacterium]